MTRFGSPMAITVAEDGSEAETQHVCAKWLRLCTLGEPVVALRGFSQLAWFSTLKNSDMSSMDLRVARLACAARLVLYRLPTVTC